MSNLILNCQNLEKTFKQANNNDLLIFKNLNFSLSYSTTVSIVGSSGSGKTSLLQILAGLDKPTQGQITIANQNLNQLNEKQLCNLRNEKLGFIYQFHHLLPEFTALENTLMPLIIANKNNLKNQEYAKYIFNRLGLSQRSAHFPSQLSGGERQRVAVARAIINRPQIIFADEPTGNLDNNTAHQVLDIFFELQQELNTSLIIVTHDREIANKCEKVYQLQNGELNSE